jgi:hypothetical protein
MVTASPRHTAMRVVHVSRVTRDLERAFQLGPWKRCARPLGWLRWSPVPHLLLAAQPSRPPHPPRQASRAALRGRGRARLAPPARTSAHLLASEPFGHRGDARVRRAQASRCMRATHAHADEWPHLDLSPLADRTRGAHLTLVQFDGVGNISDRRRRPSSRLAGSILTCLAAIDQLRKPFAALCKRRHLHHRCRPVRRARAQDLSHRTQGEIRARCGGHDADFSHLVQLSALESAARTTFRARHCICTP